MNNKNYTEADLLREWKAMSAKRFDNKTLEKQKIMDAIQSKSQLTIVTLKKRLRTKIKWSVIMIPFLIIFAMLSFEYDNDILANSDEFWMLAIISILTIVICLFLYYKFRKMDDDFKNHVSLLESMKTNLQTIKDALFVERVFGYVGFCILFLFYTYGSIAELRPVLETVVMISIFLIVLIILAIWSERKNHKKFGKHIKELEANIIRLETLQ